jgi:hypothetical protein
MQAIAEKIILAKHGLATILIPEGSHGFLIAGQKAVRENKMLAKTALVTILM